MIEARTKKIYWSSLNKRHYMSKHSVIHAETRGIILNKYPRYRGDIDDGFHFEDIRYDEPERYARMYKKLRYIVAKSIK